MATTPTQQPFVEFVRSVYERLEIIVTIVLDGAMIATAYLVQVGLLWLVERFTPSEDHPWAIFALEVLLNFGLVGTVAIVVAFDLLKRIRNAFRSWRYD
jgi:hypothetical protein